MVEMVKRSFWDWLAYVLIVGLVVLAILKGIGFSGISVLMEVYFFLVVSFVLGWQAGKLNCLSDEVEDLKKFKREVVGKINKLELNCAKKHGK